MTKHDQVMVVSLSMMFYFQRFLFDCFKYTKWKEKDNLLNFFSVVFRFFKRQRISCSCLSLK